MKSKDKIKIKKNFAILAFIISILIIIELYNKYFYKINALNIIKFSMCVV